jgi:hypothetical protein
VVRVDLKGLRIKTNRLIIVAELAGCVALGVEDFSLLFEYRVYLYLVSVQKRCRWKLCRLDGIREPTLGVSITDYAARLIRHRVFVVS